MLIAVSVATADADREAGKGNGSMESNEFHESLRTSEHSRVIGLMAAVGVLLAANVYLFWRVHRVETGESQWRAATAQQMTELRDNVSTNGSIQVRNMEVLRAELDAARHEATVT